MGDEEIRAWIGKALQHLRSAQILAENQGPGAMACYLCQQASELALKALIVADGRIPPRTHDLVRLFADIPPPRRPGSASLEQLTRWTDYGIAPRYPGFGDEQADADLAAMLAGVSALVSEIAARYPTE